MRPHINPRVPFKPKEPEDLINEYIRFPEVRVIGANGEQLGILTRREALTRAQEVELDLVCVAPQATPPVCKILNYSKHRYEQQKKLKEAKKNQKVVETKEMRLTPQTDVHDLETKAKAVNTWLQDGNRVKISMRYRGRQMAHLEVGDATLTRFIELCADFAVVEKQPAMEGRFLFCYLAPKVKK